MRAFGTGASRSLDWEYPKAADRATRRKALREALQRLVGNEPLEALAFHLLFGGTHFKKPVRIGTGFTATLGKLAGTFPLYIPPVCALIDFIRGELRGVPLFAFFETSLFAELPAWEKLYPLADEYNPGDEMAKWGFHGIYHGSNARVPGAGDKVISVVMDRYTTVCAIDGRAPRTVSLGCTPLEGILSRRSCGDVDPGIVVYLMKEQGYSVRRIDEILKHESGFYGMTGYDLPPNELITLYEKDPKVTLAFDLYTTQILKYIGDSIAVLHGFDSVVFAGQYVDALGQIIYRLAKQMTVLQVSLAELPWYTGAEYLRVSAESSKRHFYINRLDETDIISREIRARLGSPVTPAPQQARSPQQSA
jgi:acetate kinase